MESIGKRRECGPRGIPIASKKTVYEKYFYTEYTKYLFHKVH